MTGKQNSTRSNCPKVRPKAKVSFPDLEVSPTTLQPKPPSHGRTSQSDIAERFRQLVERSPIPQVVTAAARNINSSEHAKIGSADEIRPNEDRVNNKKSKPGEQKKKKRTPEPLVLQKALETAIWTDSKAVQEQSDLIIVPESCLPRQTRSSNASRKLRKVAGNEVSKHHRDVQMPHTQNASERKEQRLNRKRPRKLEAADMTSHEIESIHEGDQKPAGRKKICRS